MITPREFVDRWAQSELREQQASQSHFNELCQLVGYKTPTQMDPEGTFFTFEEQVEKATGGKGRADVWYQGRFAWEYKGKDRDLEAAYSQLLAYRGGLGNPPLLVVCDFREYRIYPQWPNTSAQPFVFKNEDLLRPDTRRYILWLLESPEKFLELRAEELQRREKITLDLAYKFAHLADLMRQHTDAEGQFVWESMQIARFLTKLVFALFAEDIGLLPSFDNRSVIRYIADNAGVTPKSFRRALAQLFEAMDGQFDDYYMKPVPYFNGGIFADSAQGVEDGLEVLDLTQIPDGVNILREVSQADWRFVNPTIFGTLFEGALDEGKRAQLGAHYTGESDIRLVVEPVLMQPLFRLWEEVQAEAAPLMQTYIAGSSPKARQQARDQLTALHDRMMSRLETTRVLDPACGSGNFLYVSLRALKDLEGRVRHFFEPLNLPFRDVVTPRQMYGIEKDEFAAKLAHVVVWIGYLQWRYEDEGILHPVHSEKTEHPRALPNPILKDKNSPDEPDRIICADAILRYDADGQPYEPEWPEVDVIMGNPPFLGGNRIRSELGGYVDDLFRLYEGRVPAFADLVCYWFEKARGRLEQGKAKRAGLLATNSIRGGVNREVLNRIKQTGDIFYAWSDRAWTLEGAAVRISIIGFDGGHRDREVGWAHTNTPPEIYSTTKMLAREMRSDPTPAEEKLWQHIRKRRVGGYKFRRQHTIDRYIVDFYCSQARLVIEVDGSVHETRQEEDAERQTFLENLGLRVLRFSNGEVLQHIDAVLQAIDEALQNVGSNPTPNSGTGLSREEGSNPTPSPSPTHWGGEQEGERGEEADAESLPFPFAKGKGLGDGVVLLDGVPVSHINADLTANVDVTQAKPLNENKNLSFMGPSPKAPFDIPADVANKLLAASNASGKPNSDVVRPVVSAVDIVRGSRQEWTIDFGLMSLEEAARYELPFEHVKLHVYPIRSRNRRAAYAEKWWQYAEARPGLRKAVENFQRIVVTPTLSKHRVFVWGSLKSLYNQQIINIARDDDYFFGALHSYIHEVWSLRMGTWLGKGNDPRYTPSTTFETFAFPWSPKQEDKNSALYLAIGEAARQLHIERDAWLNPPTEMIEGPAAEKILKDRTLTNLYNALEEFRQGRKNGKNGSGKNGVKINPAAEFAPRLAALHDALDQAVLAAYGWGDLAGRLRTVEGDEELLRRLLALNLQRAQGT